MRMTAMTPFVHSIIETVDAAVAQGQLSINNKTDDARLKVPEYKYESRSNTDVTKAPGLS